MKAAVLYEKDAPLVMEDVEIDDPGTGEILVKVVAAGLCSTDLGLIHGHISYPLPVVAGHEGAGIVEKVGPGVTALQPGDHVVMIGWPFCGRCQLCMEGKFTMCTAAAKAGLGGTMLDDTTRLRKKDGSKLYHFSFRATFAEYTVVPDSLAVKVDKDVPLEEVAVLGCGAVTGIGGIVNVAKPEAGSKVAIFGTGGLGLSAVMAARLVGAGQIIAVDVNDDRLEAAKGFGATHAVNAGQGNAVEAVKEISGGGVDYALEFAGAGTQVMEDAYNSIVTGGKVFIQGVLPEGAKLCVDCRSLIFDRTVQGVMRGLVRPHLDLPRWIELYKQGRLPLDKLVTNKYSLDQVNDALGALGRGEGLRGILVM